jgi:hypothetical protein
VCHLVIWRNGLFRSHTKAVESLTLKVTSDWLAVSTNYIKNRTLENGASFDEVAIISIFPLLKYDLEGLPMMSISNLQLLLVA